MEVRCLLLFPTGALTTELINQPTNKTNLVLGTMKSVVFDCINKLLRNTQVC